MELRVLWSALTSFQSFAGDLAPSAFGLPGFSSFSYWRSAHVKRESPVVFLPCQFQGAHPGSSWMIIITAYTQKRLTTCQGLSALYPFSPLTLQQLFGRSMIVLSSPQESSLTCLKSLYWERMKAGFEPRKSVPRAFGLKRLIFLLPRHALPACGCLH